MASLKMALLLFICVEACGETLIHYKMLNRKVNNNKKKRKKSQVINSNDILNIPPLQLRLQRSVLMVCKMFQTP